MDAVRKKAQELANAILESQEYKRFVAAKAEVESHHAALVMLRDFQDRQLELHKQQMEGKPVTEEQTEELRKLYEIISVNPYIRELFEAEFVFGGLMLEVQETLSQALGLKDAEDEANLADKSPTVEIPKKKIWTPGS
ncbi:MAG: YlbF family regulator [Limnochordia bacterium]